MAGADHPTPTPAAAAKQSALKGWLRFACGEMQVAIAVEYVEEVTELGAVVPVPMAPFHLIGIQALRGRALPVVNLEQFWDLKGQMYAEGGSRSARLIVIKHSTYSLGLVTARVLGICTSESLFMPQQEDQTFASCLLGAFDLEKSGRVFAIDIEAVLKKSRPHSFEHMNKRGEPWETAI